MTTAELIAELQKFPANMRVVVQWEGTIHDIEPDTIYVAKYTRSFGNITPREPPVLFIDADGNFYKPLFAMGRRPGEDE